MLLGLLEDSLVAQEELDLLNDAQWKVGILLVEKMDLGHHLQRSRAGQTPFSSSRSGEGTNLTDGLEREGSSKLLGLEKIILGDVEVLLNVLQVRLADVDVLVNGIGSLLNVVLVTRDRSHGRGW